MASRKELPNASSRGDASGALQVKLLCWRGCEEQEGGGREDWCDSHSLNALRLTLSHVIAECRLPNQPVLEEFPRLPLPQATLAADGTVPDLPHPPRTHVDCDKLSDGIQQLKAMVGLYEKRMQWLSTGSRVSFGCIRGSKVAVLVESSDRLDEGMFGGLREALKTLLSEQLICKEAVCLMSFGTEPDTEKPRMLHFKANRIQCLKTALHWVSGLQANGSCDLVGALRVALELPDIDTVCIVMSTEPNQQFEVVTDFLVEGLCGEWRPRLQFVALNATDHTASCLERLARDTRSSFHRATISEGSSELIQDSEMLKIKEESARAERTIEDIEKLQSGTAAGECIGTLREVSLVTAVDWPAADGLPVANSESEETRVCSSQEWLKEHNFAGQGLSLYQFLAPSAYPQLSGFVEVTDKKIISQVYNVMPEFGWHDDSIKYLHVDVRGLEQYQRKVAAFIRDELNARLAWLLSGSRVPFGTIADSSRVLLVLDCSYALLTETQVLQHQLRLLLQEQLTHTEEFNLMRFGRECDFWRSGFVRPSGDNLQEAWEWLLGLGPGGTADLMAALKVIFEGSEVFSNEEESTSVGVYLHLAAMPDQDIELLCSYIEQKARGRSVKLHVIIRDMELPKTTAGRVVPGREGGRYGSGGEVEAAGRSLAAAGNGSFHHFRFPGSVDSDDVALLRAEIGQAQEHLKMATDILHHYRQFCKRNVPPPSPVESPDTSSSKPPPTHPRQTAASLARMNACLQRKRSPAETRPARGHKTKKALNIKRTQGEDLELLQRELTLAKQNHKRGGQFL